MDPLCEPQTKKVKLDQEFETEGGSEPLPDDEPSASQSERPQGSATSFLKEKDVGITEYISRQPGFFAILKQRYVDFVVHEIDQNGVTVQLTDVSIPSEPRQPGGGVSLESAFSPEDCDNLQRLSGCGVKDETVAIKAGPDKEERTRMHRAIRENFPNLQSRTVEGEGGAGKTIEVSLGYDSRYTKPKNWRGWPSGRGNYCKFVLFKQNRDTMEAISILAGKLRLKPSTFQYAGTKDRRAVTTQNITAFKVPAEKLLTANASCRGITLGNFQYVSEPLKLGALAGNCFTIVLRNVSCEDHVINEVMQSLSDAGFVNYFGMQRFGTSTIPTHRVGECLLKCSWQEAINLILMPRPGEPEDVAEAREAYWETRDAATALKKFPPRRTVEKQLLRGLAEREPLNDLLGALNFLPRNTRTMYVHSCASLVWNKMASWRLREYGMKPVIGDLVRVQGAEDDSVVEFVTEENLSNVTIYDIVLPTPGYDILYPQNKVGEQYHKVLQEDGLTVANLKHKVRDFALPGVYRSVLTKPRNVKWEILHYDDLTLPLTLTDLDLMENQPHPQTVPGGKYKALKIELSLPPATYATMAIREVVKMETSSFYQAQLNHE